MKFASCILVLATIWILAIHVDAMATRTSKAAAAKTLKNMKKSGSRLLKPRGALKNVLAAVDAIQSCDANMCFALDGSGSILLPDYDLQKEFVKIIAGIVSADEGSGFAATQYGLRNVPISPLTMNANKFLYAVEDSVSVRAPRTFIAAGLGFCVSQMNKPVISGEPHKIVILGDGHSNFGDLGNGFFSPAAIAKRWRDLDPEANVVSAITVGSYIREEFEKITGNPDLVMEVSGWQYILDIMRDLVREICETEPEF